MLDMPQALRRIKENISQVIVGKEDVIDLMLISLLCEGHILNEDILGVGKTSLASSLSRSIGCTVRRIQFTPDVLPSDVVGYSMVNMRSGELEYHPGAVMAQIVLADEINRTSPKTQSALLEAMEERQVTVDGQTYPMDRPFMVMATQNPVEYIGTYPLPEAQMDRFLMRLRLGYPSMVQEVEILRRFAEGDPRKDLRPVLQANDIAAMQEATQQVYCDPLMLEYIVAITGKSRTHEDLQLGISPRGTLSLMRASQGAAMLSGRDYIIPDDVQKVAVSVLAHRMILKPEARLKEMTTERLVKSFLNLVKVPVFQ